MITKKISFNLVFRVLFILILVTVCFVASTFMVLESSEFFERFYEGENDKNFGFISALLNEVFLVIMAAVWVPAIQTGEKKRFHPANLLIKSLVIFLFVNTVGGASLNTVQKKLATIQEQNNRIEILKILESQIEDQQKNIKTFEGQNQRLNTVLATRRLNQVKDELKQLQTKQQSTLSTWIEIIVISLVRFTIQLANITTVWLAGWLYRKPLNTSAVYFHSEEKKLNNNKITSTIKNQQAKNLKFSKNIKKKTTRLSNKDIVKSTILPAETENTIAEQTIQGNEIKIGTTNFNFQKENENKQELTNFNFQKENENKQELTNFNFQKENEISNKEETDYDELKTQKGNDIKNKLVDVNLSVFGKLADKLGISIKSVENLKRGIFEGFSYEELTNIQSKISEMIDQDV